MKDKKEKNSEPNTRRKTIVKTVIYGILALLCLVLLIMSFVNDCRVKTLSPSQNFSELSPINSDLDESQESTIYHFSEQPFKALNIPEDFEEFDAIPSVVSFNFGGFPLSYNCIPFYCYYSLLPYFAVGHDNDGFCFYTHVMAMSSEYSDSNKLMFAGLEDKYSDFSMGELNTQDSFFAEWLSKTFGVEYETLDSGSGGSSAPSGTGTFEDGRTDGAAFASRFSQSSMPFLPDLSSKSADYLRGFVSGMYAGLNTFVSDLQSQVLQLQSQVISLQAEIDELTSHGSTDSERVQELEAQIATLQNQIISIVGTPQDRQQGSHDARLFALSSPLSSSQELPSFDGRSLYYIQAWIQTAYSSFVSEYSGGVSEAYDNGFSAGNDQGYVTGYSEGLNKGQSDVFVTQNPIALFFEPVYEFFNTPFLGKFKLGSIFGIFMFVCLALMFLKMFAG